MTQIDDHFAKFPTAGGGSPLAHKLRGGYGIDRLAPMHTNGKPTPIRALQSGYLKWRHDGYNGADIHGANGVITEQKEIRNPIRPGVDRHVKQDEIIGYVGMHREGEDKAPHDGARWPGGRGTPAQAQAYVTRLEKAAAKKIAAKKKAAEKRAAAAKAAAAKRARKAEVKRIAAHLNTLAKTLKLPTTAAVYNGIPGPLYYRLEQKYGRKYGLYDGKVTGVNNAATRKVDAHLATLTR
jgi:hypothetical protein